MLYRQTAQQDMRQRVTEVQVLLQATQMRCREGIVDLQQLLADLEPILYDLWQTAETISEANAALASELLDINRIYLSGERQLQPAQLVPLAVVLDLLHRENLTMDDVATKLTVRC